MNAARVNVAALFLLLAVTRHYGWTLAPDALAGVASKGIGAVVILCLLWMQREAFKDWLTWCIAGWWTAHEIMVAGCSGAWMLNPWPVRVGQPMCSEWIGIDLGIIAAVFVALFAVAVSIYSGRDLRGSHNERA